MAGQAPGLDALGIVASAGQKEAFIIYPSILAKATIHTTHTHTAVSNRDGKACDSTGGYILLQGLLLCS